MTQHPDIQLPSMHNDLSRACRALSYSKVLAISEKILVSFPNDDYSSKCKVVALIHSERYDDCLEYIRKKKLTECVLEKSYCEYRLNRLTDALKTLTASGKSNDAILELKSQILYRLEEFEQSLDCYRSLIKSYKDDYQDERNVNLLAARAALCCFGGKNTEMNYKSALFETDFNAACFYLGRNDFEKSLQLLNNAEKICRESFKNDPDITEEKINEEVAPILVQKAFCLQKQKKEVQAAEIYHTILRQRSTNDPSLLAVTANNLICINREQNVFDTRKRIKAASIDGLQTKLFSSQRTAMLMNQGLFFLHTGQVEACRVKAKSILDENPSAIRGILLSAAQLTKSKQINLAIGLLETFVKSSAYEEVKISNPNIGLHVPLLLVHLNLLRSCRKSVGGDFNSPPLGGSITSTESEIILKLITTLISEEVLQRPAIVALRAALCYQEINNSDVGSRDPSINEAVSRAKSIITKALTWWSKCDSDETAKRPEFNRFVDRSIDFFLRHGFAEDAASLLERKINDLKSNPDSSSNQVINNRRQNLLALLIRAYSKFDHTKAEQASRELEFKNVLNEKEIDSLESSFLLGVKHLKRMGRVTAPITQKGGAATVGASISKTTKKPKHRKIRLPKNYEPGIPPDPERWLPRRERAGYRGKRRDKRATNLLRGPQGHSVAAPELDMGNRSPINAPIAAVSPRAGDSNSGGLTPGRRPPSKPHPKRKNKKNR